MTTDRLAALLCRIGAHDFKMPPHRPPRDYWEDFPVECERGCGARHLFRCVTAPTDQHWLYKHPEPEDRP